MTTHNMLQVDSESIEYGTPPEILECVHKMLGFVSLDPASSLFWNQYVRADKIYTAKDNGLVLPWFGNIWLNHPFRKTERKCKFGCEKQTCKKRGYHISYDILGNEYWIAKLISEYEIGHVANALNICYAATSEKWYKPLLNYPICFINADGRTNYIGTDGEKAKGVQKGSSVTYLGKRVNDFVDIFSVIGDVMIPAKSMTKYTIR